MPNCDSNTTGCGLRFGCATLYMHYSRASDCCRRETRGSPALQNFHNLSTHLNAWHIAQAPASSRCRRETRGRSAPCLLFACGLCALETNSHTILRSTSDFHTSSPGPPLIPDPCALKTDPLSFATSLRKIGNLPPGICTCEFCQAIQCAIAFSAALTTSSAQKSAQNRHDDCIRYASVPLPFLTASSAPGHMLKPSPTGTFAVSSQNTGRAVAPLHHMMCGQYQQQSTVRHSHTMIVYPTCAAARE
jgi:hypothetical protein